MHLKFPSWNPHSPVGQVCVISQTLLTGWTVENGSKEGKHVIGGKDQDRTLTFWEGSNGGVASRFGCTM